MGPSFRWDDALLAASFRHRHPDAAKQEQYAFALQAR